VALTVLARRIATAVLILHRYVPYRPYQLVLIHRIIHTLTLDEKPGQQLRPSYRTRINLVFEASINKNPSIRSFGTRQTLSYGSAPLFSGGDASALSPRSPLLRLRKPQLQPRQISLFRQHRHNRQHSTAQWHLQRTASAHDVSLTFVAYALHSTRFKAPTREKLH